MVVRDNISYNNFINVCLHKQDFGLPAKWNFFATSHGKGACDGVGGTVKQLAYTESLRQGDRKSAFWKLSKCMTGVRRTLRELFSILLKLRRWSILLVPHWTSALNPDVLFLVPYHFTSFTPVAEIQFWCFYCWILYMGTNHRWNNCQHSRSGHWKLCSCKVRHRLVCWPNRGHKYWPKRVLCQFYSP